VVFNKPLRRSQILPFFAKLAPCLIGMEACASAHYWARELKKLGHGVRLMPAKDVKASSSTTRTVRLMLRRAARPSEGRRFAPCR
jgi:transposase